MYPPCIYRQKSYVNGNQFCMIDSVKVVTESVCETCEKRREKGAKCEIDFTGLWAGKDSRR